MFNEPTTTTIKAIDRASIHRITSGQVVIDLQTAVKELIENSLDAGATNIEIKFKEYGVKSVEVIDNGSGIPQSNYETLALKHHTSKLSTFEDLNTVRSFGFRGEALSSLCALSENVTFLTATNEDAPMGTVLEFERSGKLKDSSRRCHRPRGTTATVTGLFSPLPVRKREFERNRKREFGKALTLLYAYALFPCAKENKGVRLIVSHQPEGGSKSNLFRTDGAPSIRSSVSSLWGPKQVESVVSFDLNIVVEEEKTSLKRRGLGTGSFDVQVTGLMSKLSPGCGRSSADRQFCFVNGRPCSLPKIQKAFNEVYRTFNASQTPLVIADVRLPTERYDVNVSPDKRTILIHSEDNLIIALKGALENCFAASRQTFDISQALPPLPKTPIQPRDSVANDGVAPGMDDASGSEQPPSSSPVDSQTVDGADERDIFTEPRVQRTVGTALSSDEPTDHINEVPTSQSPDPLPPTQSLTPPHRELSPGTSDETPQSPSIALDPHITEAPTLISNAGAEFTRIVSPIGTKKTYTTSAAKRSLAESTLEGNVTPVQAVLSTSGASWNLRPLSSSQDGPSSSLKKRRVGTTAAMNLRSQIAGFARGGSVLPASSTPASVSDDTAMEIEDEIEEAVEVQETPIIEERQPLSGHQIEGLLTLRPSTPSSPSPNSGTAGDLHSVMPEAPIDVDEWAASDSTPLEDKRSGSALPVTNTTASKSLSINLTALTECWTSFTGRRGIMPTVAREQLTIRGSASTSASDQGRAEKELSRVIAKNDFLGMKVVGQFNLGFIVARRQISQADGPDFANFQADDLFLIDQHAADEKYNFEELQSNSRVDSQKLFRPRLLELSAADELLAVENEDVLRRNGFEIALLRVDGEERERVHLTAQPVIEGASLGVGDFEELIHLLDAAPSGIAVRCSKVRSKFASRACRKSVMIGTALSQGQMSLIVHHMATMDQPWNCPHGRPTMRHLCQVHDDSGTSPKSINWESFKRYD